ncbi:DsbA family oxidoreductase [Planococcus sp. CAU13]|uniref:DsbA family oxidoreductase n=1 Tax=Planococcus sp. CAU13 TaxID=1541197 RepID=UPI00052FFE8A|nr:DsbA family oxidoreductase [Planococcus sp. CAU13]
MKIEIWSDYVCPFCYIGKRTLEQALIKTGFTNQTEVTFKAYQLDPATPVDSNISVYESLAAKFGYSVEQAKEMTKGVALHAQKVGLEYDFDHMVQANTLAAHRLVKWAAVQGREAALIEQLLNAYFVKAEHIGNHQLLLNNAEAVGLPRNEAKIVLDSDDFLTEVEQDIAEAQQLGIQGVPFFVINRKYAISGAQPLEAFVDSIKQIADEEGLRPAVKPKSSKETSYCTGDTCNSE